MSLAVCDADLLHSVACCGRQDWIQRSRRRTRPYVFAHQPGFGISALCMGSSTRSECNIYKWIPVRIPPRIWQDLGPPGGGGGSFSSGRPVIKSRAPSKIYKGGHVVIFNLFFLVKKKNRSPRQILEDFCGDMVDVWFFAGPIWSLNFLEGWCLRWQPVAIHFLEDFLVTRYFFAQTFIGGPTPPIHFLEKKSLESLPFSRKPVKIWTPFVF